MNTDINDNILVARAKAGDSNALTVLINRYSDSVLKKANSFKDLSGLESDDLYQEGMLGLLAAVYSFDESRDVLFSTYVSTLASRKMLSALKKANSKNNLPMRSYVPLEDETNLLSGAPTPEDLLIFNEEIDTINSFVENNLSKTERKVFKLNLLGLSYSEIAEILDCSVKSVDNTLQRIRKKIRNIK